MTAARTTTTQTTATGWVLRIGSTAGIAGALLAMVGNLIHPATPIGDPEGVAATIAGSRIWVPGHLAIVVGLVLMLGGLLALAQSIQGGLPGALEVELELRDVRLELCAKEPRVLVRREVVDLEPLGEET